jgi:hypothetical protein
MAGRVAGLKKGGENGAEWPNGKLPWGKNREWGGNYLKSETEVKTINIVKLKTEKLKNQRIKIQKSERKVENGEK